MSKDRAAGHQMEMAAGEKVVPVRQPAAPRPHSLPVVTLMRVIRGNKVMLDRDLAELYGVRPIALRPQLKRNTERLPEDFMFQLTEKEAQVLVSQLAIPSGRSFSGSMPYMFTQEGVATLSSVLRRARAVQMNIGIMRACVRIRLVVGSNRNIAERVAKPERGQELTAPVLEVLVGDLEHLSHEVTRMKKLPPAKKRAIGFHAPAATP